MIPDNCPANSNGEPEVAEAFRKYARILRRAAALRAHSLDYMRLYLRTWADVLDPRPGVIDFPAEETSAPMRGAS